MPCQADQHDRIGVGDYRAGPDYGMASTRSKATPHNDWIGIDPDPRLSVSAPPVWRPKIEAQTSGSLAKQGMVRHDDSSYPAGFPALLAQLAEQLTLNQRVVGSSPTGGTFDSSGQHKPVQAQPPHLSAVTTPSSTNLSSPTSRQYRSTKVQSSPGGATASATGILEVPKALPADLQSIVDAWPELSQAVRAGIVDMVKASTAHRS